MPTNRKEKKEQIRETASGMMGCSLYTLIGIARFVVGIIVFLLIAEWLFPKYVHNFNFNLSTRTLVELKEAHHYKAAVDFYEQKHELFEKRDALDVMVEVSDCYKRIGEYEKAESILLDLYEQKGLSEEHKKELQKEQWQMDAYKSFYARELFKLYEAIGDKAGQRRAYEVMESSFTDEVLDEYNRILRSTKSRHLKSKREFDYDDLMRIYRLKILYMDSPDEAISEMSKYLGSIKNSSDVSPAYLLKCLNLIIGWTIEQHGVMKAYRIISTAVDYADSTEEIIMDKSEYGTLSDWCYRVHDIKNSKKFYEKYTVYLKEITGPTDPEFIKNQIRGFRYLEAEEKWEDLSGRIEETCESLRSLLSKNIMLMSESQREYFVALLEMPFDYAIDLLHNHPSYKLASVCLENSLFMKGLLLRSNRELSNKIKSSGNQDLIADYNQLLEYRKELSYRENLGKIGNAIIVAQLKRKIDDLDKRLAFSSMDYSAEKDKESVGIIQLAERLGTNSCLIDFVQSGSGNLVALLMKGEDQVIPIVLGTESDVTQLLSRHPAITYTDPSVTDVIFSPIEKQLADISDIYYSTTGIFNSISFPALYTEEGNYLIDKYSFHLMSNVANIVAVDDRIGENVKNLVVWGDIDYGDEPSAIPDEVEREIVRGDSLAHLVFSKDEIMAIGNIAREKDLSVLTYSGKDATEATFHSRSGKGDIVLHISTHGFFHEDEAHEQLFNPMYNSGLFFADANRAWTSTDSTRVQDMMDDGILRADEIQHLDFSDCSLAVLSACKTGLGKSSNIEGIYGLQRAFKLAGVQKILMSLWNVNDMCTAELMSLFYRYYLSGESEDEALNKAILSIRERYPSPRYWGAFVLMD